MTETARMTVREALDWLRLAVDTQGPEFVYNAAEPGGGCSYVLRTDVPEWDPRRLTGCLIGVAMGLAGRHVDSSMDEKTPTSKELRGMWNLSDNASKILVAAQRMQDGGESWGNALTAAVRCHEQFSV